MALDDDALSRALLMAGIGMMGAPNVQQGLARAGMFGVSGYDTAIDRKRMAQEAAVAQQLRAMQLAQAQQTYGDQQAERALGQRAFGQGVKPLTPYDDEGNAMPSSPGGGGIAEYAKGLFAINPKDAIALQQSLAKETPFGKIDAKDYTPESVRAFAASGDHSVLVPRVKMEFQNGVAVNPYEAKPGSVVDSPFAEVVRTPDGKGWMFNPARINPLEKQRTAMEGSRLQLEKDKFARGDFSTNIPLPSGGTGAGFVTPAGFTQAPGTGEKLPDVPASIRTAIAENDVKLDKIDRAYAAVQANPAAFGAKNYMGDAVRQRTNPEGVDARAVVADLGSQVLHDRSGASITMSEAPRLQPFIPAATDQPDAILKKLDNMRREVSMMRSELASGKSITQVAAPKDVTGGGPTPSIAEIQAEMLRRGQRVK